MADRDASSPFRVDAGRALEALNLAWSDEYDEISVHDGKWTARHKAAADDDLITGSTPDELNRAIRSDWSRRQGDHARGPSGIGPS
jgi:hypothetical protein